MAGEEGTCRIFVQSYCFSFAPHAHSVGCSCEGLRGEQLGISGAISRVGGSIEVRLRVGDSGLVATLLEIRDSLCI